MTPREQYYKSLADTVIKNLEKRQIDGCYCESADEARQAALGCLIDGGTASFGGSMTLEETGILSSLKDESLMGERGVRLIDRAAAQSPEEATRLLREALLCDCYFMSTNAITVGGELVNIDGNGNRVAALIYGPARVVIVAGMNKVAANVEEAISRVRNVATPMNCLRLGRKTPCASSGACADCLSPDCICNQVVITRRSGAKGRIKVILVGEELGY